MQINQSSPLMKKLLFILTILGAFLPVMAQGEVPKSEKKFQVVYIAHDSETPIQRLIPRLHDYRIDAMEQASDLIIYLSSGINPIIVVYNDKQQNESEFDDILLAELNERVSHDVDAETDIEKIIQLLNENEFVSKATDGKKYLNYDSAAFDFYVNPKFWTLNNNESIIAPLFFALDIPNIKGGRVTYRMYESREDRLPEGDLFGEKNLGNINEFTKTYRSQY